MNSHASPKRSGVKLVLDIGVLDTVTCEPLENVLIELWSCKFASMCTETFSNTNILI
jgi:protocatechuate 3,4-dioxygenase beta subunit